MSEPFADQYVNLLEKLEEIKSLFDKLDNASSSLITISSSDGFKQIIDETTRTLLDVHCVIDFYSSTVNNIVTRISEMAKDEEKKTDADEAKRAHEGKMSSTDAKTGIELNPVSLTNILVDKEERYNRALKLGITRLNALSALVPSSPMCTPSPPPISSVPNQTHRDESRDSSLASEVTDASDISTRLSQLESALQSSNQSPSIHASSAHRPNVSLPPIKLETFDGSDVTRWPAFKYQIDKLILNQTHLNEVEKAYYLRGNLRGSALTLVASIPVHEHFLEKIISRLESEYDRQALTQAKLLSSILSMQCKSSRAVDQLNMVQSMINIALTLQDDCGINSLIVQAQVVERIDARFISNIWKQKHSTLLSALEHIENELRTEIEVSTMRSAFSSRSQPVAHAMSNTSDIKPNKSPQPSGQSPSETPTGNAPLSKVSKFAMCAFCDKHKYSGECTEVTSISSRKSILDKKSLCHCCFSPKHSTSECSRSCAICLGDHHRSLCDKPVAASVKINTVFIDHPVNVNTRLFTSPIILTNPACIASSPITANALLDTGAQVSLISRDLATRLHLSPVGQFHVNLTGLVGKDQHSLSSSLHDVVKFNLMTNDGPRSISAVVRDTSTIVSSIQLQPLSQVDLKGIESILGHVPSHFTESSVTPDLLLSVDETLSLLDHSESTTLPCGYRLIRSIIGPLVVGSGKNILPKESTADPSHESVNIVSVVSIPEKTLDQQDERLLDVDPIARINESPDKECHRESDGMVLNYPDNIMETRDYYFGTVIRDQITVGKMDRVNTTDLQSGIIHHSEPPDNSHLRSTGRAKPPDPPADDASTQAHSGLASTRSSAGHAPVMPSAVRTMTNGHSTVHGDDNPSTHS